MPATIPPKKVINADTGTADLVGGDDWDLLSDYLNDVDTTGPVKINTATKFRNQKLKLRNPANTFDLVINNPRVTAEEIYDYQQADTWLIYQAGTNYKAKNLMLDYVPTASVKTDIDDLWAWLKINFDYGISSGASDSQVDHGGVIRFAKGPYSFTSEWDITGTDFGNKIIQIRGEGWGTKINLVPTGAQTNGIRIQALARVLLQNLRIEANDSITNIIRHVGNSQRCIFRDLWIANRNNNRVSGQVGILSDSTTLATYYTTYDNIHFNWLDLGIDLSPTTNLSNAQNINNIEFINTMKGIKCQTSLNNISNIAMQASATVGDYVVDIVGAGANGNNVSNIWADVMSKAGAYPVILEAGVINNSVVNVHNSQAKSRTVLNNSGNDRNTILTDNINASIANMHLFPSVRKDGEWLATSPTAGASGLFNGNLTAIAVGTGATVGVQLSGGQRFRWTTGTTINSLCGVRCNGVNFTERDLNPVLKGKIAMQNAVTTARCFFGFISGTGAPASSADPLANLKGVAFFYDSSVDANWHIMQNDGSASSDNTTINNVAAADTTARKFAIRADNANSKFEYSYEDGAWTTINTKIPAATDAMGWMTYLECLAGTAARTFEAYYVQLRQDG